MSNSTHRQSFGLLARGTYWELESKSLIRAWSPSNVAEGKPVYRTDIVTQYHSSPTSLSDFDEETYLLVDFSANQLIVHRGILGAHPIYVRREGGGASFGFHISQLFSRTETPALDRFGLIQFATFQFCPAPWTIIKGVTKLAPGETRKISLTEHRETDRSVQPAINFSPGCDYLDVGYVLEQIYSEQSAHADQPIGSFASGGIDSSTNALFLSKRSDIQLLTAGFTDEQFDEAPHAKQLAAELGVAIHIHQSEEVRIDIIDQAICNLAEPICDRSIVPTAALVSTLPSNIRSLVSGEGGDEFWGPPRRYRFNTRNPVPVGDFHIAYLDQISCTTFDERAALFGSLADVNEAAIDSQKEFSKVVLRSNACDAFQGAKAVQAFGWLSENVLQKDHAVARMANLPVRFPLTARLARDYIGALGVEEHWLHCEEKSALKSMLLNAGLEAVVNRPKHKFKTPGEVWKKDRCFAIVSLGLQTGESPLSGDICRESFESISLRDDRLLFGLYAVETWFSNLCRVIEDNPGVKYAE